MKEFIAQKSSKLINSTRFLNLLELVNGFDRRPDDHKLK